MLRVLCTVFFLLGKVYFIISWNWSWVTWSWHLRSSPFQRWQRHVRVFPNFPSSRAEQLPRMLIHSNVLPNRHDSKWEPINLWPAPAHSPSSERCEGLHSTSHHQHNDWKWWNKPLPSSPGTAPMTTHMRSKHSIEWTKEDLLQFNLINLTWCYMCSVHVYYR